MANTSLPTHAILAVTLNCNSHCQMCDIWKNNSKNELKPEDYLKLPSTLIDINITGGEPFLRSDLPEIIRNLKISAPKSKLIISTNGFLPSIIKSQIPLILQYDPKVAIRLSLDGWKKTHDKIRNTPQGFNRVLESLQILRAAGVKDLGIGFTIMESNYRELPIINDFCQKQNIDLSLTLVSESSIYFGNHKLSLLPKDTLEFKNIFYKIIKKHIFSIKPKKWLRACFELNLYQYYKTHHRPIGCAAASNLFYLDSHGQVFACHLKNWKIGDIRKDSFDTIWNSKNRNEQRQKSKICHDCWMSCSVKPSIKKLI